MACIARSVWDHIRPDSPRPRSLLIVWDVTHYVIIVKSVSLSFVSLTDDGDTACTHVTLDVAK